MGSVELGREAENRGKIEMNQLIRVHREWGRGWAQWAGSWQGRYPRQTRQGQQWQGQTHSERVPDRQGGTQAREWPPHGVPGTQAQG
jgi:hypothetical protein